MRKIDKTLIIFAVILAVISVIIIAAACSISDKKSDTESKDESNNIVNTDINNDNSTKPQNVNVTEHVIDGIKVLPQTDLTAGCEVYACTVVLQYLGYDINEFIFADEYLVSKSVYFDGVNRYGPDLNSAYAGDVYTNYGFGANSPIMAKCMNNYLSTTSTGQRAKVIKGETLESLCKKYIVNDIPTSCSKMVQNKYKTDKHILSGCFLDTIKTKDKVLRYSPNNEFDNTTKPKTLKRGKFRNIRVFASVPEVY